MPMPERPGGELILVVEDHKDLRVLTGRILVTLGYRVLLAANGKEALATFAAAPAPVDLILADLDLPGFSGPELGRRLIALRPGQRFLFMSGHAPGESPLMDELAPDANFIAKPYSLGALRVKVREALDRQPDP